MSLDNPLKDRWVKARTIQNYFDCSHGLIYKLMDQGTFPRPRKLTDGSVRWDGNQVLNWFETRNT